jgi:hypothetical protein
MDMVILWRRTVALALVTSTLLSLTACSPTAPSSPITKEAGGLLRDLHVCFENSSSAVVSIEWTSGVSTNRGSGSLGPGQSFCGEGREPQAGVTFSDSFATNVVTENPLLRQPKVYFKEVVGHVFQLCEEICHDEMQFETYALATYAEGETVDSDVEGHHFSVTRNADNDWINFTITILH